MNYLNELKDFLFQFDYSDGEREFLCNILNAASDSAAFEALEGVIDEYCRNERIESEAIHSAAKKIAGEINANEYAVSFVIYILLVLRLEKIYQRKGFDRELYLGAVNDLKRKFEECKAVMGVCGTFTSSWFEKYLNFENFAIGRLQFNPRPMAEAYETAERSIKKGETVIAIHIPSGGKLEESAVLYSIERAKEFFANKLNFEPENFICSTYLFHPSMTNLYKEGSNLCKFSGMFDIFYIEDDASNGDAWRIFNCSCNDYTLLPEDTSLRRDLKKYLLSGGKMGKGIGVLKNIVED